MDGRERFGWVRGEAVRGLGDGSVTGGGGDQFSITWAN